MLQQIQHMRFLSLAVLWLWGLVFWNNFYNKHAHLTENGHLIVHAHPMQKGETDHGHTEEEYIFWNIISNTPFHTFYDTVVIPENLAISFVDFEILPFWFSFNTLDKNPSSLRGPPFFIS